MGVLCPDLIPNVQLTEHLHVLIREIIGRFEVSTVVITGIIKKPNLKIYGLEDPVSGTPIFSKG
jgi:hypothetical protein